MTALASRPCSWAYAPIPDLRPTPIHWSAPRPRQRGLAALPLADEAGTQTPTGDVTDPAAERFAPILVAALLDAIQGRRSATQLIRWVSDEVLADLMIRSRLHQRAPVPLSLRSVRLQQVTEEVVEVTARFRAGDRYAAAALRLERVGNRWMGRIADFGPMAAPTESAARLLLDQRRL